MDIIKHINNQKDWSIVTFGPGNRTHAIIDHINKELEEVKDSPNDLEEWIDLIALSIDGAWRAGYSAEEIVNCMELKLSKCKTRDWPDWKTTDPNKAIEHIKSPD